MPQTTIPQITFMCPLGVGRLGQPDACRFYRASNNLPSDRKCPVHAQVLMRTTLPEDKITTTIMGEEDIEAEIVRENARRQIQGLPATSAAEKDAYRVGRRNDITAAIARARLLEDV